MVSHDPTDHSHWTPKGRTTPCFGLVGLFVERIISKTDWFIVCWKHSPVRKMGYKSPGRGRDIVARHSHLIGIVPRFVVATMSGRYAFPFVTLAVPVLQLRSLCPHAKHTVDM